MSYAGQPVLFIEYDADINDTFDYAPRRYNRFWAADPDALHLPLVMADSGQQFASGPLDYQTVYSAMVNAELARPPQAQITAIQSRSGNHFIVDVSLTNNAGVTLAYSTNRATVHAIVYQQDETLQSGHVSKRYVILTAYQSITSLPDGSSAQYTFTTPDLNGVDWSLLHILVLLDYMPGGTTGPYDMLQAALAGPEQFYLYLPGMVR